MRRFIAVLIAAASVVPLVVLVLYLILRNNPAPSGAKPTLDDPRHDADVLAEKEDAEFAAAAEVLRERGSQEATRRQPDDCAKVQDEIDWSEPDAPYRPESIEPAALFSMIKVAPHPKLVHGEHRVFIDRAALARVEAHLRTNTSVELGGLLVGKPYYARSIDSYLVVIHDAYSADEGKETAVSFEYTANTWQRLTPKLQEMPQDYVVVGSYHSHPGIGVFMSSTDINTQVCVFSQPWQVALVIDPIRNETGFFISQEGVPIASDVF
jgi:proteasome lid subunit RPN8/RPN11